MPAPITIGFNPYVVGSGGFAALSLSAANTWLGFGSVADETEAMTEFMIFCSAIAGTLGNISVSLTVTGDINGVSDNTPLAGTSTVIIPAGSWPAAPGWVNFTGLNCVRNVGTRYHYILKNLSSVPGTDYPTFQYGISGTWQYPANSNASGWGMTKIHSLDAGTTWASTPLAGIFGFRTRSASGYDGAPVRALTSIGEFLVYAARESGVVFTTPANAFIEIASVSMPVYNQGTPTGSLRFRIYSGTALLGTSNTMSPGALPSSASWITLAFPTVIEVPPLTELIVVISETTQSDTASNALRGSNITVEDSDASRLLMPFNGTLQLITTEDATANPIEWTRTNTIIKHVALNLDTAGEFKAPVFPAEAQVTSGVDYGFDSEYTGELVVSAGGSERHYARRGYRRVRGK